LEFIQRCAESEVVAEVAQVENKRPGGKGIMLKKLHVKFDESESEDELYEELPDAKEQMEEEMKEEDKTMINDPTISDLDYLKARTVKNVDKLFEDDEEEEEEEAPKKKVKKEAPKKRRTKKEGNSQRSSQKRNCSTQKGNRTFREKARRRERRHRQDRSPICKKSQLLDH